MNGRRTLAYHGIPVVDVRLGSYLGATSFRQSFVMLTDRRNRALWMGNTLQFDEETIQESTR